MTFITMVLARCGSFQILGIQADSLLFGDDSDSSYFGIMVVFGFFFLTMVQVIAIVLGDNNTVLVIFCNFLKAYNYSSVTTVQW